MQAITHFVKTYLNENQRNKIKKILYQIRYFPYKLIWIVINPIKKMKYAHSRDLWLHVGCGEDKLDNFTNIDIRYTHSVDLIVDLNRMDGFRGNVTCLFSNAFFEHLLRPQRLRHLKGAYRALSENGFICYIGIPNFKVIASTYLTKGPGTSGPIFDLYNVYRYTHGDPDSTAEWYFEQLHKSLFDDEELELLLKESGFKSYVIFQYAYPSDANPVPINLGFYAVKNDCNSEKLNKECISFLEKFHQKILFNTLELIKQTS